MIFKLFKMYSKLSLLKIDMGNNKKWVRLHSKLLAKNGLPLQTARRTVSQTTVSPV
ncbi:hypothetical protein D3C75_1333610 [compost metagenome]